MITQLKRLYVRELFFPKWIGIFTNPFYLARSGLALAIRQYASEISGKLLDVGCGTKPYQCCFNVKEYVGLDIDSDIAHQRGSADYFYDGTVFPCENSSFDSVLCNQVLEHVFNPDFFLQEINRVLKPNGKLLLTVPFVWDEHEQPHDYARYSSFGLCYLLEKNGFVIIKQQKIGDDAATLFQLANAYLFKLIQHWPRVIQLLFTVTIMATLNIIGIIVKVIFPRNPDLFLDNIVLAEKRVKPL